MTSPYSLGVLAESRGAELRREASAARLAAIASCCRPSSWTRAAHRAAVAAARLRRSGSPACCATV